MRHVVPLLLLAAGCGSTRVESVESSVESDSPTRRITLREGDAVSISTDASGASVATVRTGRGTYTSTAEPMVATARQIAGVLGKPGTTVWIRVDEQDRITAIGRKQVR